MVNQNETPAQIKEAYEKHLEENIKSNIDYHDPFLHFKGGFLSPEAEKYHREKFEVETLLFTDWIRVKKIKVHPKRQLWYFEDLSSLDIPTYYTASDLLQLYREQTNNTSK